MTALTYLRLENEKDKKKEVYFWLYIKKIVFRLGIKFYIIATFFLILLFKKKSFF